MGRARERRAQMASMMKRMRNALSIGRTADDSAETSCRSARSRPKSRTTCARRSSAFREQRFVWGSVSYPRQALRSQQNSDPKSRTTDFPHKRRFDSGASSGMKTEKYGRRHGVKRPREPDRLASLAIHAQHIQPRQQAKKCFMKRPVEGEKFPRSTRGYGTQHA